MDIAPELLKEIQEDFNKQLEQNQRIAKIQSKIDDGGATYKEANEYAIEVGEMLASAFQNNLSSAVLPNGRMYYNIAQKVIRPNMLNNYDLVTTVTNNIQAALNKAANIGIKAITPQLNEDKVDGIVRKVSNAEQFDDVATVLNEPIVTFTQSIIDDAIKANAEFQSKAGLQPKIVRTMAGGCCKWCQEVAGTYRYPDEVPKDVYRRHQNCRCTVEFHPKDGKVQNVHSKQWFSQKESDKIELRKLVGLIAEDDAVQRNIRENIIPKQNIEKIVDRQEIHRVGTKMYEQRKSSLKSKGEYGPSYIMISDEEILELVKRYSGKGKIQYGRGERWNQQEIIVTNEKIVGVAVDNRNGNSAETSVFKIHYGKGGIHIVPDYPSKKR